MTILRAAIVRGYPPTPHSLTDYCGPHKVSHACPGAFPPAAAGPLAAGLPDAGRPGANPFFPFTSCPEYSDDHLPPGSLSAATSTRGTSPFLSGFTAGLMPKIRRKKRRISAYSEPERSRSCPVPPKTCQFTILKPKAWGTD